MTEVQEVFYEDAEVAYQEEQDLQLAIMLSLSPDSQIH